MKRAGYWHFACSLTWELSRFIETRNELGQYRTILTEKCRSITDRFINEGNVVQHNIERPLEN